MDPVPHSRSQVADSVSRLSPAPPEALASSHGESERCNLRHNPVRLSVATVKLWTNLPASYPRPQMASEGLQQMTLKKLLPLTPEDLKRVRERLQAAKPRPPMQTEITPLEKIDSTPSFQRSRSAPVGPAQRRQVSATLLQVEPKPLSVYDDNPVFEQFSAARLVGVTADCLKKWRQRGQGPDYIQYGPNGPVRYELNALLEYRDRHTVKPRFTS
jgi:hypothetical protein